MRINIVILLITLTCLHVSAKVNAQKITITAKDAAIEQVFEQIEQKSGYDFFYDARQIKAAKLVTLNLKNAELKTILDACFKDQPFSYSIQNKTIVVTTISATSEKKPLNQASQARITIKGKVTDQQNKALEGVSIRIKGRNTGTLTDEDGNYTIGAEPTGVIIFSYIGYQTFEIKINGQTEINMTMVDMNTQLDQIQIIAYGTTTRRLTTSNIGSVKAVDIQKQPVSNPLLALQGRVPGLIVSQVNGISGGDVHVQIQGRNSIQNGNDPFYVIDGVPYNSNMLPTSANILGSRGGSPFNFINPSDIESIEVLKDADATSIYGSRAANGAILITTKKGLAGKSQVDINFQQGWGKVPKKMKLLNTEQYLALRKEAKRNDNATISQTDYDINGVWDTTRNVDWQKELLGNTAHFTNLQASLSGGNAETQFLVGAGYIRETAVFPGDFADRKGSVNFNIQHRSQNEKFRIQLSGNYLSGNNQIIRDDLTSSALSLAPNAPPLFNEDGTLNWGILPNGATSFLNPMSRIVTKFNSRTANLIGSSLISYQIIPGIIIKSTFGFNSLATKEQILVPLTSINPNAFTRNRTAYYGDKSQTGFIIEPQIEYSKQFSFGGINMLIGSTYSENMSELTGLNGMGYNSDASLSNIRAASTVTVANAIASQYRYNAAFARLTYNYMGKYILNLNARRDGSSRFGSENQFHNFYSIGGAWIFSEEPLLKDGLEFLNYGKLRLSYGTTGNDQIGDYSFLSLFDPFTPTAPYQGASGLTARSHANPFLQWELTKKFNAGIDLGFFSNRLLFNVNYYINTSSNQLLSDLLPIQTGFDNVKRNFPATVRNSGLEAEISVQVINISDFNWNTNLNFTLPKNKLVSFPNFATNTSASSLYVIGEPVTITKVYHYAGVNSQTGIYEFINSKGERTTAPNGTTDRTEVMNTAPKLYGGWLNSFSFKGFELDLLFQFNKQTGYDPYTRFGGPLVVGYFNVNQPVSVLDRWRSSGETAELQRANSNLSLFTSNTNANNSDEAYTDVSFIRLKNVSISYTVPEALVKKLRLNKVNVFAQGQNLATITKFKGLNPESSSALTVPPLRMITMGFRANL